MVMPVCGYKPSVPQCVTQQRRTSFGKLLLATFLVVLFILYSCKHQDWKTTIPKVNFDFKSIFRGDIYKGTSKSTALEKDAESLLQTSWIKYFPALQHLVKTLGDLNYRGNITSAKYTTLKLLERNPYQVGEELKAKIIAYDENGVRKKHGGDYFLAALRRPGFAIDGVSCEVLDNFDGIYDVNCILPWKGNATLNVTLLHPAESVYQLMKMHNSDRQYGVLMVATVLNSKNKTEKIFCSTGFPDKNASELCDYSNPVHGEKRMCIKAPSGECPPIISEEEDKLDMSKLKFFDDVYFRKDINHHAPINGSSAQIYVKEGFHSYFTGDISKVNFNPLAPNGWFFESKWNSIKTKIDPYTTDMLKNYVRNKRMYFFGDSTMRQWFYYMTRVLKLKHYGPDNSVSWTQPREAESKELNANFHFRAHGPPLRNPGPPLSRPYISNSLDAIQAEEHEREIIICITIGLHFELSNPDVYYRRLQIIKQVIISLFKRIPGAKVIIKGLPSHSYIAKLPTMWKSYIYDVLLRHTFHDVEGVIFFDCYDYTFLANMTNVHPNGEWLTLIIELLLNFLH